MPLHPDGKPGEVPEWVWAAANELWGRMGEIVEGLEADAEEGARREWCARVAELIDGHRRRDKGTGDE